MKELNQIKRADDDVVSHHVFMYPFRWDFLPNQKNYNELNFDERTQMTIWDKFLEKNLCYFHYCIMSGRVLVN
jgi:predicted nuclease of restriction endonuclease-like (RecB) superfamily